MEAGSETDGCTIRHRCYDRPDAWAFVRSERAISNEMARPADAGFAAKPVSEPVDAGRQSRGGLPGIRASPARPPVADPDAGAADRPVFDVIEPDADHRNSRSDAIP